MHSIRTLFVALALFGAMTALPATAHAAEAYDNCSGYIDSLPATITTQGTWCLRQNLSTAMIFGNAITIAANNVTLDCNDFKIGGLAAGNDSLAIGIRAEATQNTAVRRCGVRGFSVGISLLEGNAHVVEDNRVDNNLTKGIEVTGTNHLVQRNRVLDTGGKLNNVNSIGIYASADVIENVVAGVFATSPNAVVDGIRAQGEGNEVRGNQVRGLVMAGSGTAVGIRGESPAMTLADNQVSADTTMNGTAITGHYTWNTFCIGNTVVNYSTAYTSCAHSFGNLPAL
ncbi:MAG TPA: NosD domain-containing protein [Lysobacter sp.]